MAPLLKKAGSSAVAGPARNLVLFLLWKCFYHRLLLPLGFGIKAPFIFAECRTPRMWKFSFCILNEHIRIYNGLTVLGSSPMKKAPSLGRFQSYRCCCPPRYSTVPSCWLSVEVGEGQDPCKRSDPLYRHFRPSARQRGAHKFDGQQLGTIEAV